MLLEHKVPPPILPSVAWIIGEYASKAEKIDYVMVAQHLLKPNEVLEPSTVAILIQASMKIYCVSNRSEACLQVLQKYLPYYQQSEHVEVMHRSFIAYELLKVAGSSATTLSVAKDDGNLLLGGSISITMSNQDAIDLLLYLYRPEAMKPISAKVQRKKRQQYQIPGVDLDDPEIDPSVAAEWLDDQVPALSMEAVGFTQQQPMESISAVTAISSGPVMDGFGSSDVRPSSSTSISPAPHMVTDSSNVSFQHTNLNPQPPQTKQQRNDPFYLDSHHEETMEQQPSADQFGMIQLDDVHDDDENDKRKKKRSKKKKVLKEADFGIFSANATSSNTTTVVYASDDDDDVTNLLGTNKSTAKSPGFAKIDLTVEDEAVFNDILPTREHRSVSATPTRTVKPEKKAKKKKSKAIKSSTKSANNEAPSDMVGDLLGFSASAIPTPAVPASTPAPAPAANAISTAFDDLLSLEVPEAPAPIITSASLADDPFAAISGSPAIPSTAATASKKIQSTKKGKKLPWMKATLKSSSSEGITDWSKVSVYYRVSGTAAATMVSFRADNNLDHVSLDDLSITWRTDGSSVSFGTLGPDQSGESPAGPFVYKDVLSNLELRGALGTSTGSRVPIKVSLPATVHFSPVEGLSQEVVMSELGSSQWSLESIKLEVNNVAAHKVGSILKCFFRAAQVAPNDNIAMGTLASATGDGTRLFVLYKVKEDVVKVDIKCSEGTMIKPVVADLKRLLL